MKTTHAVFLFFALVGLSAAVASTSPSLFSTPLFPTGSSNSCAADKVSVVFAPDNRAIAILRRDGSFIETIRGSRNKVHAACLIDLVLVQPRASGQVLRIDLRGADHKAASTELELEIRIGSAHHKVVYPRGQLLDGATTFRRFQLAGLAPGQQKVRLKIEAKARSFNGDDSVLMSLDSFDACFVDVDSSGDCSAPPAPAPKQSQQSSIDRILLFAER